MILNASDIYALYRPSRCELRVFLKHAGEPEAGPGPFDLLLRDLGERHERAHLATLGGYEDASEGDFGARSARTRHLVQAGAAVIYQPLLMSQAPESFGDHFIIGIPDLLIRSDDGYTVRDCKLALHANEGRHPEILRQLELYGWLYQRTFGRRPSGLEVLQGDGTLVPLPFDGGGRALAALADVRDTAGLAAEPYSPVGWTRCQGCGFQQRCWGKARAARDVAMVYGVDQGLARALHDQGVFSIDDLLERYDAASLGEVRRPHGSRLTRVGKAAGSIVAHAEAMLSGREIRCGELVLPVARSIAVFDVEALPPYLDGLDRVYLWGVQVFGEEPTGYRPALAGFGPDGDREGWGRFLEVCGGLFERYGDIPFVHWHSYERTRIDQYVGRYGDPAGIAAHVRSSLVDLLPVTRNALALPDPSYSLKVVEKRAGFARTMDEYGGDWSIAQYIRAVETEDAALRDGVMAQILKYNEEDLAATWAVLQWLRGLS